MKRRRNINKNRKKSHSPLLVSLAQWYVCLLSWPYLGLDSYGSSILVEYPWQIFFFYEIDISWVISFYILIFMILHMTCKHIVVHWCWGLSPVYLNVTLILIHYSCKVFLHIILTKWLDVFFFLSEEYFFVQDLGRGLFIIIRYGKIMQKVCDHWCANANIFRLTLREWYSQ